MRYWSIVDEFYEIILDDASKMFSYPCFHEVRKIYDSMEQIEDAIVAKIEDNVHI